MNADAKHEIVARIRAALRVSNADPLEPGAASSSSPDSIDPGTSADLCARFAHELAQVNGETIRVAPAGTDALAHAVADLIASQDYQRVAVHSHPLAASAASRIDASRIIAVSGAAAALVETADCAILGAESLIAETGSVIVSLSTYAGRLLPYLPRACIVVADAACVRAGFDAALFAAGADERGERVIIAGPSRTADIEKTIVLGAHGPASLTVFITSK